MSRPRRKRRMMEPPAVRGFKPYGISAGNDMPVKMLYEEYEALRLADYEKLSQVEAAQKMDISRPTFTRIYDRALKKIAVALNESRSLLIEGGNVLFEDDWFRCEVCHSVYKTSKSDTKSCSICGSGEIHHVNKIADQPGHGKCICAYCGEVHPKKSGKPCRETNCHKCGQPLKRYYE